MNIGHIHLQKSLNGTGEHFVKLVECLDRQGAVQHVIVRNRDLAKRLAIYDNVTVGPVATTPVVAYCLMPQVSVAHMHDDTSGHAGLLLTLTRSIPYVLTSRRTKPPGANPIRRSIYSRAASVVCPTRAAARALAGQELAVPVDVIGDISFREDEADESSGNRAAAEHMRIYRRAVDSWRVPAILL